MCAMAEPYLMMAEIEAKYPNQWVLIANAPTCSSRPMTCRWVWKPTGGWAWTPFAAGC